ncbi:sortase A [Streptomyces zhaozhouensis]|uniref:Sortase A n=1 Tax=Streptomyces zhaozhouensis TaxID=1300267 RepID=A0A286DYT9_9ACTN|nr:class E sortase [Streptomyces zhaozhouensis]SOD63734.1 sortase A [Streptomyces zhaozhouensis]
MNTSRPGAGAEWDPQREPYADDPYLAGERGGYPADPYQAAVDALNDPLGDPLPGQRPPGPVTDIPGDGYPAHGPARVHGGQGGHEAYGGQPGDGYPAGPGEFAHGNHPPGNLAPEGYDYEPPFDAPGGRRPAREPDPETMGLQVPSRDAGEHDPETVGLRRPDDLRPRAGTPAEDGPSAPEGGGRAARRRAAQRAAEPEPAAAGGRAARRRAAKGGGRRGGAEPAAASAATAATAEAEPEVTGGRAARRKAAKAAAKAAKQTGTAISNLIGELFITTGVLLLLFVVYQLWWTNYEARAHANKQATELEERWNSGGDGEREENRDPGVFSAGEGFAILYLPTLDVRVPVAESVDPASVLDNGMVGHYTEEDGLPTAMPWDEEGNFGLAGHRNTHGEPFRYINNLEPGDPIVIETESTYYTYEMRSRLDSTSPSNIEVLDPVPEQGGFAEPGRYITLTTCTPEFTSTYRLIVWGELAEESPRSEGKPDALVN